MVFEISSTLQPKTKRMLTRENTGLQHIRNIKLIASATTHYNGDKAAHQWLEVLLSAIPKNVLERLRCVTHLLWHRQSTLENIEIFPQYIDPRVDPRDLTPSHEPDLVEFVNTHELSAVTKLRMVPDNTNTALIGSSILKRCAVTDLTVDARLWCEGSAHYDAGAGHIIDPLTSALFVHATPAPLGFVGTVNTITKLALSDIDLRHSAHTWLRCLDVTKLKDLRLEHCANVDIFLGQMSTNPTRPGMQSLTVVHDLGNTTDRTVDMLEDLLMYTKAKLETLNVCLRNAPRLPSVASLKRHAYSLRRLTLNVMSDPPGQQPAHEGESCYYDEEELEDLLEDASEILHLALHLPPPSFLYKSFAEIDTAFTRAIDIIISNVCDLHTLTLLDWPIEYPSQIYQGPEYYVSKTPQLARLAGDIFQRFRHFDFDSRGFVDSDLGCNLEIISFGAREYNSRLPFRKHFVESLVTSLGRTRRTAELQELSVMVLADLEVDIIDYEARRWNKHDRTNFNTYGGEDQTVEEVEW
ncbi:hypothetical protein LTR27_003068 [Elasticomyces elasticus]|nr:hypothetical protein LTR27_003068 [Elasticomyces elasticus]